MRRYNKLSACLNSISAFLKCFKNADKNFSRHFSCQVLKIHKIMYRRKVSRFPPLNPSTSSNKPTPVYQSQKAADTNRNEKDYEEIVSSQENQNTQNTQNTQFRSRISTQRQAILSRTQEQINIGKGPIEIALTSLSLIFSEIGIIY
jgi:hypothetical protein